MSEFSIGLRKVGDNHPCFIVAEAGVNHNGDIKLAKKLIDVAAEAGVDAVKFQVLTADGLYIKNAGEATTDTGMKVDAYGIWKGVEMSSSWIPELSSYCKRKGVVFFASVFEEKGVEQLEPYVSLYKIASSELTHIPLLKKVAKTNKPIIVSVGSAVFDEVIEAVKTIRALQQ